MQSEFETNKYNSNSIYNASDDEKAINRYPGIKLKQIDELCGTISSRYINFLMNPVIKCLIDHAEKFLIQCRHFYLMTRKQIEILVYSLKIKENSLNETFITMNQPGNIF